MQYMYDVDEEALLTAWQTQKMNETHHLQITAAREVILHFLAFV